MPKRLGGDKKSNKGMIVMITILVILGLSAAGVGYYLYTIDDFTPKDSSAYTLNTSDLCQQIVAVTNTEDTYTTLSGGTDQEEDIQPADTTQLVAIYDNIPADAPDGYSYSSFSILINSEEYEVESEDLDSMDEDLRKTIVSYFDEKGTSYEDLATKTYTTLPADILTDSLDKTALNVVATGVVTTPEGERSATCGDIFTVDTNSTGGNVQDNEGEEEEEETTSNNDDDTDVVVGSNEDEEDDGKELFAGDTSTTSNISVTKTGTTCVNRVSPDNIATFTVTIRNLDTDTEVITEVKDKLPLGFTYVAGSTTVDGTSISDINAGGLSISTTDTGSSQEIVWEHAGTWTLNAGSSTTISFRALASEGALTGSQQNEVIVTPENTPTDPASLRTEYVFLVAQNCENPQTGLFDTIASRVIAGFMVIALAAIFYRSDQSISLSESLVGSKTLRKTNRSLKMFGLKLTRPRDFFENKFNDED